MNPSATRSENAPKNPHMPPMHRIGELIAPVPPQELTATGLEDNVLTDLALRLAYTVPRFTTDWVSKRLHLSMALTADLLGKLYQEGFVKETMKIDANPVIAETMATSPKSSGSRIRARTIVETTWMTTLPPCAMMETAPPRSER